MLDNIDDGVSGDDVVSAEKQADLERAVPLTATHAANQNTANELIAEVDSVTDLGGDDYLFNDDLKNDLRKV